MTRPILLTFLVLAQGNSLLSAADRLSLIEVLRFPGTGLTPYKQVHASRIILQSDRNGNGSLEQNEDAWDKYAKLDTNGDDSVSLNELAKTELRYLETGARRKLGLLYKRTQQEDMHMDLYYPTTNTWRPPVIIYTHGGGWTSGSKHMAANETNSRIFKRLLDSGFCVAAMNYRLVNSRRGTYVTDSVVDCKDAIRFLARESGPLKIDRNRFFVFGEGAGGHLAQMLLLTEPKHLPGDKFLKDEEYTMVGGVTWFGYTNLEGERLAGVKSRLYQSDTTPKAAVLMQRALSPTAYISSESPRLLVIHGEQDTVDPVQHARYL